MPAGTQPQGQVGTQEPGPETTAQPATARAVARAGGIGNTRSALQPLLKAPRAGSSHSTATQGMCLWSLATAIAHAGTPHANGTHACQVPRPKTQEDTSTAAASAVSRSQVGLEQSEAIRSNQKQSEAIRSNQEARLVLSARQSCVFRSAQPVRRYSASASGSNALRSASRCRVAGCVATRLVPRAIEPLRWRWPSS